MIDQEDNMVTVAPDEDYESDDGMSLRSVIEELEELLQLHRDRRCREAIAGRDAIDFEVEEFDFVDAQFGREG